MGGDGPGRAPGHQDIIIFGTYFLSNNTTVAAEDISLKREPLHDYIGSLMVSSQDNRTGGA